VNDRDCVVADINAFFIIQNLMDENMVSSHNLPIKDGASDISIWILNYFDRFFSVSEFWDVLIDYEMTKTTLNI